jgi:hypothetical protein
MRFSAQYELMIYGVYGKKSELFQYILSPLISYQTYTKLLIIAHTLSLKSIFLYHNINRKILNILIYKLCA